MDLVEEACDALPQEYSDQCKGTYCIIQPVNYFAIRFFYGFAKKHSRTYIFNRKLHTKVLFSNSQVFRRIINAYKPL